MAAGALLGGKYRLEALLGKGGMGSVWRARNLKLDAPVAVKLMDPAIATDQAALMRILVEPKNAIIKQYQKYFELEKVRLKFTDDAVAAVAREAMKRGTGARGLRAVLEEVMLEVMYELPSLPGLKECIITREVILNKDRPILISEQKEQSA